MVLLLYALRGEKKDGNAGVKNGICKYQMQGGCFNISIEKDSATLNSGECLCVQACAPAVADIQGVLIHSNLKRVT